MAEPAPTKKRRKKRRAPKEPAPVAESEHGEAKAGRRRWLWIAIAAFGLAELWLFGAKGDIRVCVARDGEHDFSLVDTPRTEDNTQRYPSCERRLNVGLRSHFDERVEDAMLHACRRATILRGKEATIACALEELGWTHRVEAKWVPPWNPAYYKRLFWFVF